MFYKLKIYIYRKVSLKLNLDLTGSILVLHPDNSVINKMQNQVWIRMEIATTHAV